MDLNIPFQADGMEAMSTSELTGHGAETLLTDDFSGCCAHR
jgi:hypothetical protein